MGTLEVYKTIFDSVPDAVVITDSEGKIILANKLVKVLFGYETHELVGQDVGLLIPTRFSKNHKAHLSKFYHKPQIKDMGRGLELAAKKKDGTEFPVEIGLSFVQVKDQNYGIASVRDVTDKNRRIFALKKAMTLLENKNKELEQFTYIASHDLQEPLQTVSSFVELLREENQDILDDSAEQYINYILQSTQRMKNLISGLLDYSRIGKEKTPVTVDCNEILGWVLDDLRAVIDESGAKIENGQLPILHAYPNELKQLFQNLIGNAIKYVKPDVSPVITISYQQQGEGWLFEFKDNGIGIEEKYKEKIFIIFKRLHSVKEYDGTGIGLAHCRKIVELHHGKIWIESVPNEGSKFCFTIKNH